MASYGYIGAPANFNGTDPDTGGDSGESMDFPSLPRSLPFSLATSVAITCSLPTFLPPNTNESTTSLRFPEKQQYRI